MDNGISLPITYDMFYECRSGQHGTCEGWCHSVHPTPAMEIRCACTCHGENA